MTTKAIKWTRQQKALMPDKPFFMYFAPGATHAPHHVPKSWADKYKGKFDQGWDALREEIFARQKQLGVIPADAELTPRPAEIQAWADTPKEMRPVFAREMEVYAGYLEHVDTHLGRLIDTLEELGVLDDTLIYYIIGDNGASAEGTPNGAFNEMASLNGLSASRPPSSSVQLDDFGGPKAYNHYAVPGHTRSTHPTSGPSRSRHIGVVRATAPSCTGRTASREGRDPQPVPSRHRRRTHHP